MTPKPARGFPTVQQSPTPIRSNSAECSYGGVEHIAGSQPASDPDRLEAATDQTIAACGGNLRQAVKALIVANEFLAAYERSYKPPSRMAMRVASLNPCHVIGETGTIEFRTNAVTFIIKNGLYKISTEFLDGAGISNVHVIILHDGKLHGGGPYFSTVESYTCSGRKWKGEATTQEHTPFHGKHPGARKFVTSGFAGTYRDDGAEIEAATLVGKQSVRFNRS
jgi:hypothetical protein